MDDETPADRPGAGHGGIGGGGDPGSGDADAGGADDRGAEAARYLDDLIARGEAAAVDADGNLPDGATHELVTDEHGRRRAVRRRFFGMGDS